MHFIKKIIAVQPYLLKLQFEDNSIRDVDMKKKLENWSQSSNSIFRQLLNESYFKTVKLNSELETIYWDNGVDFCPDMLFQWSVKT